MTIYLPEVRRISLDFMSLPVFNPNVFSEDEDDLPGMNEGKTWISLDLSGLLNTGFSEFEICVDQCVC